MSYRKQQVESTLKRAISQVLMRRLSDPRITGMVSITRVEISSDQHNANVFISVLPEKSQQRSLHGLRHAAGHIHILVRSIVAMRTVPRLHFQLDESLKKQAQIFEAIDRGIHQDQTIAQQRANNSPSSDQDFTSTNPIIKSNAQEQFK